MNRLRAYRRIEQITQARLGERLGISTRLVSNIESGSRTPPDDLSQLGYTRVEIPEMTEPLHRQKASTRVSDSRRAQELLRVAGEAFDGLSPTLSRRHRTTRLEPLGPIYSDDDLSECAAEVRTGVLENEENAPIRNLTNAVERAGICLVPIVGLPGIDGLSSWVGSSPRYPIIGLNINAPGDRFRMSLAHELAHLTLHTRKTVTSEAEAYRFASLLLISDEDFEGAMPGRKPTLRDFIRLKSAWGISVAALVHRARYLRFLDESSHRSIQIQMSKWRKKEPAPFPPKPGRLLRHLVKRAGGVNRCAQQLGLNPGHLRDIITWHHLRIL